MPFQNMLGAHECLSTSPTRYLRRQPLRKQRKGRGITAILASVCFMIVVVHQVEQAFISTGTVRSWATGQLRDASAAVAAADSRRFTCSTGLQASRRFFVGGNWKANGSPLSAAELMADLNAAQLEVDATKDVDVVCAPPYIYLTDVQRNLRGDYQVAAQNMWHRSPGAWTGEIPGEMLKHAGIDWVILGHSERRENAGESSQDVADKTKYAIDVGLNTITCIGEKLEEREAGSTFEVLAGQMQPLAAALAPVDWENVVIAYEPVWAIGTGKVATSAQAEEVHAFLRSWLATYVSSDISDRVRILYGGSVTDSNSEDLARMPNIDGFLVGGTSLNAEKFTAIVNSAKANA